MYNCKWGQDRRRFQRLNLNLVVWYKLLRPMEAGNMLGTEEREAITVDIIPFDMAFMSSYNIPLEVNAKVRSCTPTKKSEYRAGVSFSNIQLEQQQKLVKFAWESQGPFI